MSRRKGSAGPDVPQRPQRALHGRIGEGAIFDNLATRGFLDPQMEGTEALPIGCSRHLFNDQGSLRPVFLEMADV